MKKSILIIQKSLMTLTSLFVWVMIVRLLIHILLNDVNYSVPSIISFSIVSLFIGFLIYASASLLLEVLKSKEL
jgi:hypothetical protein